MLEFFQSFLTNMRAGFSRIARATRHEKEVDDLHNDAFVLALDIGHRRGRHIDFSDPEDQDLVMRALYVENVKRGDWKLRRATRIDHEPEGEEEASRLIDRLPAQASSDPLTALVQEETDMDAETLLASSYSQATAYVVTIRNFKHNHQRLCAHLVLSQSAFARRMTLAANTVRKQPSMFDCVERIPVDFTPLPGQEYALTRQDTREVRQSAWNFREAH